MAEMKEIVELKSWEVRIQIYGNWIEKEWSH